MCKDSISGSTPRLATFTRAFCALSEKRDVLHDFAAMLNTPSSDGEISGIFKA